MSSYLDYIFTYDAHLMYISDNSKLYPIFIGVIKRKKEEKLDNNYEIASPGDNLKTSASAQKFWEKLGVLFSLRRTVMFLRRFLGKYYIQRNVLKRRFP